jgi:phage terminase Nu1 subunit (DNA packaging protein)
LRPAIPEYVRNDREASGDLAAAKLKLTDAQRRTVERKNATAEARLIERAHVEQAVEAIGVLIGSQLDGIGGRLAGEARCDHRSGSYQEGHL